MPCTPESITILLLFGLFKLQMSETLKFEWKHLLGKMTPEIRKKLHGNVNKVFMMNVTWMFLLLLPVIVPFFRSKGLSMKQVYELQAIFSFCFLIFEIPSGYLSDLLGRKKTLLLAGLFHGISFTLFPFMDSFWALVGCEVLMAFGTSMYSGTDVALLYDSLDALNEKGDQTKLMGRRIFYSQMGETAAGLVGGALAMITVQTPAYVNAVFSWFPFIVAFFFFEPPRKKMDSKKHGENIKYIFNSLFRESKLLKYSMYNTILYGVATLVAVWAFQEIWDKVGISLGYFGLLWALSNLTVALVARKTNFFEHQVGSINLLIIVGITPIIGFLGLGYVNSMWVILFCLVFQVCRGLGQVMLKDAINSRVSADMRATANSVSSMGVRVCFVASGPLIGYLMDKQGHAEAFSVAAGFYVIVFFFFLWPLIKHIEKDRANPKAEED